MFSNELWQQPPAITGPVNITFIGDGNSNVTSSSSFTFSSESIGTESSDRVVLVSIYAKGDNAVVTSVTIGGTSMSIIKQAHHDQGDAVICGVAKPTGTSGDLVINVAGTTNRIFYGVHTMTGTGGSTTAHDTGSDINSSSMSLTLDIPEEGGAVCVGGANNSGGVTVSGLTKDWEEVAVGSGGGGSDSDMSANSSLTVSMGVPTTHEVMVAVSFAVG